MMEFSQMFLRLAVALIMGVVMGSERAQAKKEPGIRTGMMISAGASLFAIIALNLPVIVSQMTGADPAHIAISNSGFLGIIANIVVGIGFIGSGIIIQKEGGVHGLTSAGVVWSVAAVGVLSGIGMLNFAIFAGLLISFSLFCLRTLGFSEQNNKNGKT